ncbi:VOC family protein [Jeotgalibacillus salarius]|uniref:VOC family protein n=1 Tax=Jeotgalibacillus salarius TaxID=546023 RepID=UPI00141B807C|nr:VOC family protein [Jeotgalibacillus salarius]
MFKVGSIFIPVTDLEHSSKWYEEHFQVKLIGQWEGGAGFYFPDSAVQLGLIEVQIPQPSQFLNRHAQQNTYFNLITEDIVSLHKTFIDQGLTVRQINEFGGMKYFDCADPDGNVLSIVEEVPGSPFHSEQVEKLQQK